MRKTSLRWKTVNFLFILVALAFVIGLVLCAIFSTRFFVRIKQSSMKELYELINSEGDKEELERKVFDLCEKEGITLLVKDSAGAQIYSLGHSETMSQRLDDITFGEADFQEDGSDSRIVSENADYTLQIVNPKDESQTSYVEMWGFLENGNSFIARSSLSNIQNNIRVSLGFFSVVCAVILIISAVAIYFIIGYYSKPITRLAALSQKVNEGDFNSADFERNYEYKHLRQDEIGVLGENIMEISEKLEKNIADLKTSNLNLENELKRKTELEEARKKYMSDVSHELKTPIALISGYAEGLKEGISSSKEDRDFYCDVIIDEAEKMNVLIKRLSTLNQLEEGKSAVSLERFNVIDVINGFLNTMSVLIEEKGANIFFDNSRTAYVWSDEFLFEEVLVNYFNNALNHMDDNQIIRINVEKVKENYRVTVFNSGDPIPEDEIPQIWGKFYKIDKARTREYGGSGLGLSIVKAVADSLNKSCGVENLQDGVAFWIDLEAAAVSSEDADSGKESVADAPRKKLSELPIWQKTASTASKIISSTTKIIDRQSVQKAAEKPAKRKPKKTKAEKPDERKKKKDKKKTEPEWVELKDSKEQKEKEQTDAADQQ